MDSNGLQLIAIAADKGRYGENSPSGPFEIPANGTFLLAREVSNLQLNF
jgi:hypothetical protein